MDTAKKFTAEQQAQLLNTLEIRFKKHTNRHEGIKWASVLAKLIVVNDDKLWSLYQMEITGGEPDVIKVDELTGEYVFYDCSTESPKWRRSYCYDSEALESRKEFKPANNVVDAAKEMGISLLTEEAYRSLQQLEAFDLKTSSWILTPPAIRKLGGAVFCDRRYNSVFLYHNGAESYYAARGFRGSLRV